jgi:hypothetical protein
LKFLQVCKRYSQTTPEVNLEIKRSLAIHQFKAFIIIDKCIQ